MSTAPVLTLTRASRRTGTRSAVSALRLRRRPMRLAPALVALAAAGALVAAQPTTAEAGPIYDMCVDLVDGWHSDCTAGVDYDYQTFGCDWVAGVGYLACGVIGAAEIGIPLLM